MKLQFLILPVLVCAAAPPGPEVCGYVYSKQGDWRLAPQFAVSLTQGMELHAGDQIKLMTASRPGHINVGLLNGKLWATDCDTDSACRDPLTLPGAAKQASLPQRLLNLMSGFSSHTTPVVFTLSRSDEGDPAEAVLRLTGNRADLTPALRSMGAVPLNAKLMPVSAGPSIAETGCAKANMGCSIPLAAAGLYKLEVRVEDREPQTVLVLVAADADYRRIDATFAEALRVADSWGRGAHADARHYFLSASLNELALTGKAH